MSIIRLSIILIILACVVASVFASETFGGRGREGRGEGGRIVGCQAECGVTMKNVGPVPKSMGGGPVVNLPFCCRTLIMKLKKPGPDV